MVSLSQAARDQRYPAFDAFERGSDNRTPGQRDRDRVHYSSALRRLTNVTQVAAAMEGPLFHNRLTHTFEVAQIARRIAELLSGQSAAVTMMPAPDQLAELGGLDPDVVEAAALAHDLGHPPFGHIGEDELNQAVGAATHNGEGFEGNAQSFRIVTRLALRNPRFDGLNLTRATLNAILKYPWLWPDRPSDQPSKWGAYAREADFFAFAREGSAGQTQSLEAAIMDWADDIAYAIHDVEDFYRAGLIPLDVLSDRGERGERERGRFVRDIFARYAKRDRSFPYVAEETAQATEALFETIWGLGGLTGPYDGSRELRSNLRTLTAQLISRYILSGAQLGTPERPLSLNTMLRREVTILKELTWHYVIEGPHLATQQAGQRRIVGQLFEIFLPAVSERRWWSLPVGFADVVAHAFEDTPDEMVEAARLTADLVAGLTEQEAVVLHQRLTGVSSGSLLGVLRPR